MKNNKPSVLEMLTELANNHKFVKEMNISGLKRKRRIAWMSAAFQEDEIESQYGYMRGSGKL